jgi:hypothetical protein
MVYVMTLKRDKPHLYLTCLGDKDFLVEQHVVRKIGDRVVARMQHG